MSIRRSLIIALLTLISIFSILSLPPLQVIESSQAADCVKRACIKVFTQDGQIVIEANKGGSAKKTVTVPATTSRPRPLPSSTKVAPPKPIAAKTSRPANRKVTVAPRIAKKATKKIPSPLPKRHTTSTKSLSDRLVKLLPVAKIARAPKVQAIINVPMIFWCDLPTQFFTKISIVGEVVDISMRPAFFWSFGDGAVLLTTLPGADYPRTDISHIYRIPGRYLVTLVATWGGIWSADGVSRTITGKVRQTTLSFVDVLSAPTVITR